MSLPRPLRILVMEDDIDQAELVQRTLEDAGYDVEVTHDGESGLAKFQSHAYDVVIVDHQMPGKDSMEVLHTLVAWSDIAPMVMINGQGDETVALEAMKLGAGDYIVKDVAGNYLTLLPAVVEQLLEQQRLAKEKAQAEESLHRTLEDLEDRVRARTAELQQTNAQLLAEIEERRRVEEVLRQQQARIQGIVDTAVDGIITIDDQGVIESFNAAAERMFGYRADEVIGQNITCLMPSPERETHDAYLERYRRTGERKIIGIGREVVGQRKDGETFPVDLAVGETAVGEQRIFTGIVRDITARKRAAEELQRADRLSLVGQLASGLAHEIGTPLNVIAGNAELLQMDLKTQGLPTETAEVIGRQTDRITGLVQQLLAFARVQPSSMGPFELREPLVHALRLLEPRMSREGITTTLNMPDELPACWGAPDQIEQVCLNVLVNAWHAMPDGGTLTIGVRETDQHQVRMVVQDTGGGIPANILAHVFEPFYTTKGEQGTGLGLAICKQIIDNHQGNIILDSTSGISTTVTIDLPQAGLRDCE